MVFYTFRRFKENFLIATGRREAVFAGGSSKKDSERLRKKSWVEIACQVIVTFTILIVGIYIMSSGGYNDSAREAAAGWIGGVIGYWLR